MSLLTQASRAIRTCQTRGRRRGRRHRAHTCSPGRWAPKRDAAPSLGMFRILTVDASQAAIQPGDLPVASPRAGYEMKATARTQAIGAIIGKALGSLATGEGALPIIVTLQ